MSATNCTRPDFAGQKIYVGIDVGKRKWSVTILTEEFEHKTFSQDPDPVILVKYLRRHFPGATYISVYEAGYSGYWIHEQLVAQGIENRVVHPADVPTNDKQRRFRTDQVDSRKLAICLRNGDLAGVFVPARIQVEARSLVRIRHEMTCKQTRCKNQIKAFLSQYGFREDLKETGQKWSNRYIQWLENLEMSTISGRQALDGLLFELRQLRQNILQLTRQIRALSQTEAFVTDIQLLRSIPGIGLLTAMTFLTEVFSIDRFDNFDQLTSYVGLIPERDSSGDKDTVTGITHRRNPYLRWMLIESSWIAVRKDPALLRSFQKLHKRMKKNQAIIRIAKKLLRRIRYILKHRQMYVIGIAA